MRKCDCCKEEKALYWVGNFHLCKNCYEVAKKDYPKIKEVVRLRQEKKIDKMLSKLMEGSND